ncbi:MAG: ROK family protein [Mycolicibacterium sp.]|uniref:ROK family protein n=1 Tax=Mycolicibacterium sp. TaxID=2320850 RepID=UPI003D0C083A
MAAHTPDRSTPPHEREAREVRGVPGAARTLLAVDIGGTKIAVGLVDGDGALVHRVTRPTPAGDAEAVWRVVDSLSVAALAVAGGAVCGVGVASAGPIDVTAGTVSPINISQWQDFPIVDRLAATVGAPVQLAGDGLCMALGERWRGAGQGADFLLGIVVSTGVGGGLVLDGAPYRGRTGNAGHVGHVVVDPHGQRCACGGRGCVETIAAGPQMVQWARRHGWVAPPDADARHLADAAAEGDGVALGAFERGAEAVAALIASVGAVCDLDRVVVGGGVANAGALLFDPLRDALRRYATLSFIRGLEVLPASLGGAAGLVGAAALALSSPS